MCATETEAMWQALSHAALITGKLAVAERSFAALGDAQALAPDSYRGLSVRQMIVFVIILLVSYFYLLAVHIFMRICVQRYGVRILSMYTTCSEWIYVCTQSTHWIIAARLDLLFGFMNLWEELRSYLNTLIVVSTISMANNPAENNIMYDFSCSPHTLGQSLHSRFKWFLKFSKMELLWKCGLCCFILLYAQFPRRPSGLFCWML